MYARVASFEGGDMERLKEMSEQQMAAGSPMPDGVTRVLVLHDDGANRRLFITLFESREAIEAATERFEAMGNQIPEEVRGRRTAVDVYEVVFDQAP